MLSATGVGGGARAAANERLCRRASGAATRKADGAVRSCTAGEAIPDGRRDSARRTLAERLIGTGLLPAGLLPF